MAMTLSPPSSLVFRVDPAFAEAVVRSVLSAADRGPEDQAYRQLAMPVYEMADPAARDRAFLRLAVDGFEQLGLTDPLRRAIKERPAVSDHVQTVLVGEARGPFEEGITWEPGAAHLGMRLEARRFLDRGALLAWARHVLGHAEDTMDPAFGFRPGWEASSDGRLPAAAQARLHRLWDVTIDARLARAGLLADRATPTRHRERLAADLPGSGPEVVDLVFERLWTGPRPTFEELSAWAARPIGLVTVVAPDAPGRPRADRCPLCRFPADDVVPPERSVADLVVADYPAWQPDLGLCGRCTDRYRFAGRLGGGR